MHMCTNFKNEENYIIHLDSKSHKTKLDKYIKYLEKFDPWG